MVLQKGEMMEEMSVLKQEQSSGLGLESKTVSKSEPMLESELEVL